MTCQFQTWKRRWKGCKMGEALSCKYLSGCFHLQAREAQARVWCVCSVAQSWCVCSVAQSCLTLCDLMGCSPPGSSVYEILQASILEWVAISSSKKSSQPKDWTGVSCISCICKRILCHWATIGSPTRTNLSVKEDSIGSQKFRGIRLQAEWTQRFKEVSRVKQITGPGWMHETSTRTWCSGRTWRERVGREVGGGSGWGRHVNPRPFHFNFWQISIQLKKKKERKKKKKRLSFHLLLCLCLDVGQGSSWK